MSKCTKCGKDLMNESMRRIVEAAKAAEMEGDRLSIEYVGDACVNFGVLLSCDIGFRNCLAITEEKNQ